MHFHFTFCLQMPLSSFLFPVLCYTEKNKKGCDSLKQIKYSILLGLLLLLWSTVSAFAKDVTVQLDGNVLSCRHDPVIENDRVLVPMRDIMEPLGYEVVWNEKDRSIVAKDADTNMYLTINNAYATVNNTQVVLDAAPRIIDDITMVPLRFVADYSGASVSWNPTTYTVSIERGGAPSTPEYTTADSVVYIQTNKIQGSGIVLSEDGLIATNFHVIENASTAQIIFNDGTIYSGGITIVGLDPQADIALLQIDKQGLHPVTPSYTITAGEKVTAIGSPKGKRNVSSTGTVNGYTDDIISMTAPIAHGSSGGGLFNAAGQVIGMCSSYSENQYFAIPIEKVLAVHRTMNLPISGMKNYVYKPSAPRNISYTRENGYTYFIWEPVYDADYYYIYIASEEGGNYQQVKNTTLNNNQWYWNYPHAFGISIANTQGFYIRIATVRDGVVCGTSNPIYVPAK